MNFPQNTTYDYLFQSFPDILTVSQLSRMLKINEKAAYQLVREKLISCFKIGRTYRIPKTAVFNYLEIATGTSILQSCHIHPKTIQYECQ